ncbi:hypothetical protein BS17DRAFT_774000 [Gyrodon lividus]|nr:hypothetical protein BS17DRAFT_774000 [Gyrodon lividus]
MSEAQLRWRQLAAVSVYPPPATTSMADIAEPQRHNHGHGSRKLSTAMLRAESWTTSLYMQAK